MSDFVWDGRLGRYRDKETGRIVSEKVILGLSQEMINTTNQKMQNSITQLFNGNISIRDFEKENAQNIKILFVQHRMLGAGGYSQTKPEDWLELGRELKNNQYPRFHQFVKEIEEGKLSQAQAAARLQMYSQSAKSSFQAAKKQERKRSGFQFARRYLGSCKDHCGDCITYATWGVVPIAQLIPPCTNCRCGGRCCCYVEYRKTAEELI